MEFKKVFGVEKPVIGMLHLKGDESKTVVERAAEEINAYIKGGINGLIVENYFGTYQDMVDVLDYLKKYPVDVPIGVNCLHMDVLSFELAQEYPIKFIQMDSVVGHLRKRDEVSMQAFLDIYRKKTDVCLFGGVRFKYQPVLSENSLEVDLNIAKNRCDAICVTGNATGEETGIDKIKEFRAILGSYPLVVAAGVTKENIKQQLAYCDAAIVGSTFKDTRKDSGNVSYKHVEELMNIVKELRR